ncbi:hypothetical protein BDD12DRAFT_4530 [Trichophaea hybrida]|nr:hypothetical protein BDD12DRAFT_4530 [Trichophaea hybrida]
MDLFFSLLLHACLFLGSACERNWGLWDCFCALWYVIWGLDYVFFHVGYFFLFLLFLFPCVIREYLFDFWGVTCTVQIGCWCVFLFFCSQRSKRKICM